MDRRIDRRTDRWTDGGVVVLPYQRDRTRAQSSFPTIVPKIFRIVLLGGDVRARVGTM